MKILRKRRFISVVMVIAVFALGACAGASAPAATASPSPNPTSTVPPTPGSSTATPSTAETVAACPPIDADLQARMRQLEGQVIQLRGLQPTQNVRRDLLTPEQLRARVEQDLLDDYSQEEADRDARLLSLLGLIEPGLDLHNLYVDLLSEQVAGYYDSQEEEMLIVCGAGFGGLETFSYVHEYVHALQDQTYDLEQGLNFNEEACELDGERCFALRALIEGDASLLQEQWLRTYADEDTLESLLVSLGSLASPVLDSAPEYIQAELSFPYLAGLSFTRSLYLEGGWAAVDAVFNDAPVSTEQILHPERYPRDIPIRLAPPADTAGLPEGWELVLQDVLGEWVTQQVLLSHVPPDAARQAAGGWGGDLVFLLDHPSGDASALVLITQWDTMRDAHQFSGEFLEYGERRFGEPVHRDSVEVTWAFDGGASHFLRQSNQTRWIIAPDGELLSVLQSTFKLPLGVAP